MSTGLANCLQCFPDLAEQVPIIIVTDVDAIATGRTLQFCIVSYRSEREQIVLIAASAKNGVLENFTRVHGVTHRLPQHSTVKLLEVYFV